MSIELLPMGMTCAKACSYCYQEPTREAGNASSRGYDMDAMKVALLREGHRFTVFGGEPLLMPITDLEELWRWGHEQFAGAARRYGQSANGVQTDGYLITDEHVRLFCKYDVAVGISIDGPGELNDLRPMRAVGADTRAATAATADAIARLLVAGIRPGIITTLHRANASAERLPRLLAWVRELSEAGVRSFNFHLMEIDDPAVRSHALTDDESATALLAAYDLRHHDVTIQPVDDMARMLRGFDQWSSQDDGNRDRAVACVWNGCDPYTTDAVRGVDGQGRAMNCGRTYKLGVAHEKAARPGFERYVALYQTPQAWGGCAGCRFFFACKGHCPGTAIDGDWRARTEHCGALMKVFEELESRLSASGQQPLSLSMDREPLERALVAQWQRGRQAAITPTLAAIRAGVDIDDAIDYMNQHGDAPHGDTPHGDSHGDHTDASAR